MLHFGDSVYEAELRRDALVEHDEDRLAHLAAEIEPIRRSAWTERNRRLMTWLGGLMVDLGCELQSRYATDLG